MKVSARAPSATPSRVISARPRVMSAARAFSPGGRPGGRAGRRRCRWRWPARSSPRRRPRRRRGRRWCRRAARRRGRPPPPRRTARRRAGRHQRGGLAARHLEREARARQHAAGSAGRTGAAISWPSAPLPPRSPCTATARAARGRPAAAARSAGHRRGDDEQAVARHGPAPAPQVGRDRSARRQRHLGQVARLRPLEHARGLRGVARPQQHVVPRGRGHGQRRAPGAGAEHAIFMGGLRAGAGAPAVS
jgi:hypothetical protein